MQALLLQGGDAQNGLMLDDLTPDESKQRYREWNTENATHSEENAGIVEIVVNV